LNSINILTHPALPTTANGDCYREEHLLGYDPNNG